MESRIIFIIADKQDLSRAGLSFIMQQSYQDCSILPVDTPDELQNALSSHSKPVVIFDFACFPFDHEKQLLQLKQDYPESRWMLFSNELNEELIRKLSKDAALSMILKENAMDEIRLALKCTVQGTRFLCHQVSNLLLSEIQQRDSISTLTTTELEVLKLIAYGKSVKEIAAFRHSSVHTIATHKKNIFRKIEVNSVHEVTKYALRENLIEMIEYYI